MRKWNNAIQKMIDAFELMKYDSTFLDDDSRTITEGLDLLVSNYSSKKQNTIRYDIIKSSVPRYLTSKMDR